MDRYVFVHPHELIKGVSADLAQRNSIVDAVAMTFDKILAGEVLGFNVSLLLEFPSPLVPDGHVDIHASGKITPGAVEAERSAMMALIEGLRSKYQFFAADYSYILISEKRALFNAMKNALEPCCADFVEMSVAIKDCLSELKGLCQFVSVWIGDNHPFADKEDLVVASSFHAVMEQQAQKVDSVVTHANRLFENIVQRIRPAEFEDRFDATVPAPMEICWDRCYRTLQVIYEEAVKKVRGAVSSQFVVRRREGQFRASVECSESPYLFSAEPASTQNAALAKLFYAVIKHVHVQLGYSILDFHTGIRQRQDVYIDRFDRNMKGMKGCAELIMLSCDETLAFFDDCVLDLTQKLQITDDTAQVLTKVDMFSDKLRAAKVIIDAAWQSLVGRQVLSATLQANHGVAA